MFVSQKSIDVTSHNIANVNTEGYSRQRAELQTRRPFCTPSMNNAAEPGQLGTGVDVTQIARIDRKSTRLNSSHANISYAVFCLKKKKKTNSTYQSSTRCYSPRRSTRISPSTSTPS